jgi:hypothetical protein
VNAGVEEVLFMRGSPARCALPIHLASRSVNFNADGDLQSARAKRGSMTKTGNQVDMRFKSTKERILCIGI